MTVLLSHGRGCLFVLLSVFWGQGAVAADISREEFVKSAFSGQLASMKTLWLNQDIKAQMQDRFGYRYAPLRLRYWRLGERSAWILDEVGKERPITFGIVVEDQRLVAMDVLVYRESRGGEICQRFFTEQFWGARLTGQQLDRTVDGITGATLSVRASEKVAKIALFLHQMTVESDHGHP